MRLVGIESFVQWRISESSAYFGATAIYEEGFMRMQSRKTVDDLFLPCTHFQQEIKNETDLSNDLVYSPLTALGDM
jgi:hypothetical protein